MWLLFRTLKLTFCLEDAATNPYATTTSERFLYSVWHDSMVIPTFAGKQQCSAALISQHSDGGFVAQVLRLVGMVIIRGSTNRIGAAAVRELFRAADHYHVVITPDGPRGPNRTMSSGIVRLASNTGRAIIPTAYATARCWRFRGSWSDLIIPKPFAHIFLLAGEPIRVPPHLRDEEIQQITERVQAEMDRLECEVQLRVKRSFGDR